MFRNLTNQAFWWKVQIKYTLENRLCQKWDLPALKFNGPPPGPEPQGPEPPDDATLNESLKNLFRKYSWPQVT